MGREGLLLSQFSLERLVEQTNQHTLPLRKVGLVVGNAVALEKLSRPPANGQELGHSLPRDIWSGPGQLRPAPVLHAHHQGDGDRQPHRAGCPFWGWRAQETDKPSAGPALPPSAGSGPQITHIYNALFSRSSAVTAAWGSLSQESVPSETQRELCQQSGLASAV